MVFFFKPFRAFVVGVAVGRFAGFFKSCTRWYFTGNALGTAVIATNWFGEMKYNYQPRFTAGIHIQQSATETIDKTVVALNSF